MPSFLDYANQKRLQGIADAICGLLPPGQASLLDVGCGDGRLARRIMAGRAGLTCEGVDVVVPADCAIPTRAYDGQTLPCADATYDIVLCADMLHHTTSPLAVLQEAVRVSRRFIIVKDHVVGSRLQRWFLTQMDAFGNAGTGVPMPFNFLEAAEWTDLFDAASLTVVGRRDRLQYWWWPVNLVLDQDFHFVALLERRVGRGMAGLS